MKKILEARVSSRRHYSCSPSSVVLGSLLHPLFAAPLSSKEEAMSELWGHLPLLLPAERSRGCQKKHFWHVHLFPWTLSVILFGSHQSTLECSHLLLVPQTSKPNLLTIPEAPLHLLTTCSRVCPLLLDFCLLSSLDQLLPPPFANLLSKPFSAHLLGLCLTKSHPFICRLSLEKVRESHLRDLWQGFTV